MTSHAVICILNWQRALSVLWKALAKKQVELRSDHGVGKEEAKLRKRMQVLRMLAVATALLDTVLSVAASVILTLLLISGDVEENPGPGGNDLNSQLFNRYGVFVLMCILIVQTLITTVSMLRRY